MKTFLLVLVGGLAACVSAHAERSCCAKESAATEAPRPAAASLWQLDSTWTNDLGRDVTLAELKGHPVVLAMMFTRCGYACPLLVNDVRRLRAMLPEAIRQQARFVLVSFDDANDTAPVLHAYRSAQQLDDGWVLLHGSADEVRTLAMVLGVQYKKDANGQYSHSNVITLLNPSGEIAYQHTGLNGDLTLVAATLQRVAGQEQGARGQLRVAGSVVQSKP